MKIYVSHPKDLDYLNGLYKSIRESDLNTKHEFFLPYENGDSVNSKEIIKNSDLILADISLPSTGQGIELGWGNAFGVPVVCVYKEGANISGSLKYITEDLLVYTDEKDLIVKLTEFLSNK